MPVKNESFTTADLRLCFRICRLLVFSCSGSYFMSLHNEIATRVRRFDFYGGGAGRKKYLGQVIFCRTYCIIYKRQYRVTSEKKMSRPENIFQPSSPSPRIKIKWSHLKRDLIACFHSDVNVTFVFSNNLCLKYGCLFRFKDKQHQSISAQT